jgi:lipoic acid synthetase
MDSPETQIPGPPASGSAPQDLLARPAAGLPIRAPKPPWLKVPLPGGEGFKRLKELTRELKLNTVCEEARCPNMGECWKGDHATMTIMVLGDECTRRCRFCAVKTVTHAAPPDPDEPLHVGQAIGRLALNYVVITSVDRDDLPDGGAAHYAECIRAIRQHAPDTVVETLIPDYRGARRCWLPRPTSSRTTSRSCRACSARSATHAAASSARSRRWSRRKLWRPKLSPRAR